MADERISSFVTEEGIADLLKVDAALESITQRIVELNAAGKKAEGISTQARSIEDVAKAQEKLTDTNKDLTTSTQALTLTAKQRAAEQARLEKAARAEQKALDDLQNDYKQLSKAYDEASVKAHNYALRLGEAHPITIQAQKDAANMAVVLKRLDAAVGSNRRSVGDYTLATRGLQGSFQQIARELPSLSNGLATFFSAIGNNIAPAADAIKQFKEEQKALAAQGKATQSLTSALAGSIFNLQTGLLLAVTALTLYGKEIVNYIFNTEEAGKETKKFTDYVNDLGEGLEENNKRLTVQGQLSLAQAKARGVSAVELAALEQKGFEDRLNQQEAFINESVSNETFYAQQLSKIQGGIKLTGLSEEDAKKQLEAARAQTQKLIQQRKEIEGQKELARLNAQIEQNEAKRKTRFKDLTSDLNRLRDLIVEFQIALKSPSKSELDRITKDIQDEIDISGNAIEFKISADFQEEEAKKKADALLQVLNTHIAAKKGSKKAKDKKELTPEQEADEIFRLSMELSGELQNLQRAFGDRKMQQLDLEIKAINDRRDAEILAIEASTLSEEEKRRKIAELNIAAREQEKKIEREKIEAQRRAAIFERGIQIAQIVAHTAKAIVSVLPNYVLAGLNAAIGAAQIAAVFAAPLPSYEEGTKGKPHKGGPAIMFEGGKAEAVFEPGKAPWIGTREGVYDLAAGSHVMSNKELVQLANMYTLGMPALIPQRNGAIMDSEGIKQGLKEVQQAIERKPESATYWTWQGVVNQTRINGSTIDRLHNLRH